jgi:hypothetical protein
VHDWYAGDRARVCCEKLGSKVVAPLHHDVVLPDEHQGVLGEQTLAMEMQSQSWRDRVERTGRRVDLRRSHVLVAEEDLPVEVTPIDLVVVAQAEYAYARTSERQGGGAAETPYADDEQARARASHGFPSEKYPSRLK